MQQSKHAANEFGGECLLGKLCRLEKQCGRLSHPIDPLARPNLRLLTGATNN
jgi:hypothetical protein